MTYVGAWFNLLTLAMIVWVMAFVVPKIYVLYRTQIDRAGLAVRERMAAMRRRLVGLLRRGQTKLQGGRVPPRSPVEGTVKVEKKVTVQKREKIQ